MTASRPAHRPLKFQSVEDLEEKIEAYFRECDRQEDTRVFAHDREEIEEYPGLEKGERVLKKRLVCSRCKRNPATQGCVLVSGELKLRRPYTVTGLAVWLDTTRQTLLEYQGEVEGRERDPRFADTILRAKQRIENYAEERLFDKDYPTRGVIFSLSNNADRWTEKKQTDVRLPTDGAAELAKTLLGGAESPDPPLV